MKKDIIGVFVFKVRELAESLERSLSFGASTKKPAGGVSLHFQGNGDERSEPQRTTAQQSSGRQVKHALLKEFLLLLNTNFLSVYFSCVMFKRSILTRNHHKFIFNVIRIP